MLRRPKSLADRVVAGVLAVQIVWLPVAGRALAASAPPAESVAESSPSEEPAPEPVAVDHAEAGAELGSWAEVPEELREELEALATGEAQSAPPSGGTGEGKSAATPQAISLPTAEGTIKGMGESFTPVLTSGAATYSVPIALPPGRAGFAPQLALSYSSTSGNSEVGFGWGLGFPFIARQSDRGLPRYVDAAAWQAEEDRFFFNGGQELVPVDSAAAEAVDCGGTAGCAPVPAELAGWQQYRARLEGAYQRFFRSPDGRRWVVHQKNGTRLDFGALPVADGPTEMVTASASALHSEYPAGTGRVYRWLLTRATDPHGSVTYYVYDEDEGQRYLADIYYLSPAECGALAGPVERMRCGAALADYGRRVHLVYEGREDEFTSFTAGWAIRTARRVRRIEVTAAMGAPGARSLVRRYHLSYQTGSFHSLLESVQLEGRPESLDETAGVNVGIGDVDEASLDDATVGPLLPPLTFRYSTQPTGGATVAGFGGIDATVRVAVSSPPHSVDEDRADLFDVNSDGLPDLIVTNPAVYHTPDGGPAVGVFFNGFEGPDASPADSAGTFSAAVPMAVPSGMSAVLTLSNANVMPMDLDGDGRADLLHMPRVANYGYFTPTRNDDPIAVSPAEQGWQWSHVPRAVPAGETDPRIDFSGDGGHIRILDVNNDHLADVVRTTGTRIQTWLNLGWLPDGDGRFGSYEYDGTTWVLSTEPVESCLPVAGMPLDFADPQVRLGDMNGDGLQDIVRVRPGDVVYWPGRGEGVWGVGAAECPPGLAGDRHVTMAAPPAELNPEIDAMYLADVNADGVDDVVQVRFGKIDVWFNRAGESFTGRVVANGTPLTLSALSRVRLTDIDGSATVDVLFAESGAWKWVDLMGGTRPRLLVAVDGGLGALTELGYASSAEDYLADLRDAEGCTWSACERFTWTQEPGECDAKVAAAGGECVYRSGGSPVVSTVVRSVETTDRFDRLGREENRSVTRYAYHDGYYEGIEQEFRGFGAADVEAVGDAGQPTGWSRTYFHQGRRPTELASDRLAENPVEVLKGRAYLVETFDEGGVYLQTSHTTYATRRLHEGLSGLGVYDAYPSQSDELRYDVTPFVYDGSPLALPEAPEPEKAPLVVRGAGYAHMRATVDEVDAVGNVTQATKLGRVRGEFGETVPDERIVSHDEPLNLDDSATGWLWRPRVSWVTGADAVALGHTTRAFTDAGDEESTTVAVSQGTTYSFGGDLGSPTPEDLEATASFDVWGNVTAACGGGDLAVPAECLRHRTMDYDTDYAAFPESESVAVGQGAGGFQELTTSGEWDRGTGAIMAATDPNEERSEVLYDGFGRVVAAVPPPVLGCSPGTPATRIAYHLTTDPEGMPLSEIVTTTLLACGSGGATVEAHAYVDGLGRARAALTTGDDTGTRAWVKSGLGTFTKRGSARRACQPVFTAGPPADRAAAVALPPLSLCTTATHDAFGRPTVFEDVDGTRSETRYRALSTEAWDALDLDNNTPSIQRVDGHGRAVAQVQINLQPGSGSPEYYQLWSTYRADGAVVQVQRAQTTDASPPGAASIVSGRTVVRTFDHDTVGRRVATTDPDTQDPATGSRWRYLFNRAGDLVAVRDPRDCGQNFYYDLGGRLLGEEYVDCDEAQVHEGAVEVIPAGAVSFTVTAATHPAHVRHFYDGYGDTFVPDPSALEGYPTGAGGVLGRQTGTADRAQQSVAVYDQRGNLIWQARRIALMPAKGTAPATLPSNPGTPGGGDGTSATAVEYDEDHTYVLARTYDHGNRPRAIILPRDPDFDDVDPAPLVTGHLEYGQRGLPQLATVVLAPGDSWPTIADGIASWPPSTTLTEQVVVADVDYDADGQVHETTYGDDVGATRAATTTTTTYDARRRPTRTQTLREATETDPFGTRPLGAVTVPLDQELTWDAVSNLTAIRDWRIATEWPVGHRPQSVQIDHDALYRVVDVAFDYTQDDGTLSPTDTGTDWRYEYTRTRPADPMRASPAPQLPAPPDGRVASLTWEYDWLGNMVHWGDDAHAFYERSLGAIANGADAGSTLRPSALYLASDLAGTSADRGGYVELDYGVGGNAVAMTVRARCVDAAPPTVCADPGGDLATRRSTLNATCSCAYEQHYQYRWDELNRLAEARRYDRTGGTGTWALAARQRYRYDGANVRILKQTIDPAPRFPTPGERLAVSVYPGDVERRGLVRGGTTYQANATLDTETQYVVAGARVVWQSDGSVPGFDPEHRFTVPLTDLLGTTSAVLDLASGALLEESTYYPNGARETFLTTVAASSAPEPAGFTGKEADEEVGLVYFGERYLIPRIGRWASPDPLAIHALGGGEAMNSYHYVSGNLLQARDPLGLEEKGSVTRTVETVEHDGEEWTVIRYSNGQVVATGSVTVEGCVVDGVPCILIVMERNPSWAMPDGKERGSSPGAAADWGWSETGIARCANNILCASAPIVGSWTQTMDSVASALDSCETGHGCAGAIGWSVVNGIFFVIDVVTLGTGIAKWIRNALFAEAKNSGSYIGRRQLRDPSSGRYIPDPANPASPHTFSDTQRRREWRRLANDPNSPLTSEQREAIKERGWRGPQRTNDYNELETMELSHEPVPLREGGKNVVPRWPEDHAAEDPYRHLKKRD